MKVIGLTGYGRSGKDSFAEALADVGGYERKAFATPVKEALLALDPKVQGIWSGWHVPLSEAYEKCRGDWDLVKAQYPEVRELWQRMGTEVGRKLIYEDLWVDKAELDLLYDPNDKFVYTDMRFLNEAEWVRSLKGVIVRVDRPGVGPVNDHISESEMDDIEADILLVNLAPSTRVMDWMREQAEELLTYLEVSVW